MVYTFKISTFNFTYLFSQYFPSNLNIVLSLKVHKRPPTCLTYKSENRQLPRLAANVTIFADSRGENVSFLHWNRTGLRFSLIFVCWLLQLLWTFSCFLSLSFSFFSAPWPAAAARLSNRIWQALFILALSSYSRGLVNFRRGLREWKQFVVLLLSNFIPGSCFSSADLFVLLIQNLGARLSSIRFYSRVLYFRKYVCWYQL